MVIDVLPAYAGMIPIGPPVTRSQIGAPRIRGDDPAQLDRMEDWLRCSPHTRG